MRYALWLTAQNSAEVGCHMPFVRITIVREAIAADPKGKKASIGRKVSAAIAEATNLPVDEISIVFEEVAAADWYVGNEDVQTLKFASGPSNPRGR